MHIPPYHQKRSWQIFALGLFFGSVLAYFIFLYMYGQQYGDTLVELNELRAEVKDLERQHELLLQDQAARERDQALTIQSIDIHFINGKQFKFDRLTNHQLSEMVKEELEDLIGKKVTSVGEHSQLLTNIIEKNPFTIGELTYLFTIKRLIISEKLVLDLHVTFAS